MDYNAWENENQELENVYYVGDIQDKEFVCWWLEADLWLEGGRVAKPRMEGPGIRRRCMNPVITPLLEGVRVRGEFYLATRAVRHTGG